MTIDLIVTRHGEKERSEFFPGSEEDKHKVDLTNEGKVECYSNGNKNVGHYPHYSHVLVIHSGFLRTKKTAEMMLEGAGYKIDDSGLVALVERADIGISSINWRASNVPPYSDSGEAGDNYRKILLTQFYTPRKGEKNSPVMAGFAYALFDSTVRGISSEMKLAKEQGKNSLLLISTHAPIMDAFGNSLYGSLVVGEGGETKVENYPGIFKMGEFIKGRIIDLNEDPVVLFTVKGKEIAHRFSELNAIRDMHKSHSQYK